MLTLGYSQLMFLEEAVTFYSNMINSIEICQVKSFSVILKFSRLFYMVKIIKYVCKICKDNYIFVHRNMLDWT